MHCYNNDILPHKAPCVLMATHGYMSERRPSISSHSVALTLLPTLSRSTVLNWSFSSFSSVCANPLSARPYLSPRGYLNTFRPTHTFLSPSFWKLEAPAKWFTLTTHQQAAGVKAFFYFPSLKSSLRFTCHQRHSLHIQCQNLHNLIFTSVPSLLLGLQRKVRQWWGEGKDMLKVILEWITVIRGIRKIVKARIHRINWLECQSMTNSN